MAAKLLHSLADDNPDLHKQIGCMTGIFQLFDRRNIVTAKRITHKKLPPGHSRSNCSDIGTVHQQEKANDSTLNEDVNEKHMVPTESSRDSLSSSSCSSSLSFADYYKSAQLEASSFSRINFPETPSAGPLTNQLSKSSHSERQPFDLREVVKDSMHREVRTPSAKMAENEDEPGRAPKSRSSPRLSHVSKSAEASSRVSINRKQVIPDDFKESLRVLAKLRDAPWNFDEAAGLPRSSSGNEAKHGNWNSVSRDSPRLSYDGRERSRLSFESRNFKFSPKLKELPRLSLDSRDISVCGFSSVSAKTPLSKNFQDGSCSTDKASDLHSLGNQKRPPNVVAKLMGLETFPETVLATETQTNGGSFAESSESRNLKLSFQPSASDKSLSKCPRRKNPDLVKRTISSSRLPIETAPWRKLDGPQVPKRSALRHVKGSAPDSSSFYGEIEKRLKNLEFQQSGKDLRALKQILEAIQAKALSETGMGEQALDFEIQGTQVLKSATTNQKTRVMNEQNRRSRTVVASSTRGSDSSMAYESPIIIMKPAKLVERSGGPTSSMVPIDCFPGLHKFQNEGFLNGKKGSGNGQIKVHSPRTSQKDSALISSEKRSLSRNVRLPQTSLKPQLVPKESPTSSTKNSDSISPRLRQRKVELEKRFHPPAPPDSNKSRGKTKQTDLNSHCGKNKPKASNLRQCDQSSEISTESRTLSYQSDELTQKSDGNLSLDSKMDIEVISSTLRQPMNSAEFLATGSVEKLSPMSTSEDGAVIEQDTISQEHSSPVSVLDASLYRDDETTPEKHIRSTLQGNDPLDSSESFGEDQCNLADSIFNNTVGFNHKLEMDSKKFKNIEDLVQKLQCLNSHHDERETDYIASLCENTNPHHRYISEILLASGLLLRDLGSGLTTFQLHPSGNPLNPELFLVLEKTKASSLPPKNGSNPLRASHSKSNREKAHRKLIFDAVNEILVEKLALTGAYPEPWLKPTKLAKRALSGQKILKELCYEMDQFQAKKSECSSDEVMDDLKCILRDDVMQRSGGWTEFHYEVSDVVLDVERMIFKDLVNEIIIW